MNPEINPGLDLFEWLDDAYLIADMTWRAVALNRAFVRWCGTPAPGNGGSVISGVCWSISGPDDEIRERWIRAALARVTRDEALTSPFFRYEAVSAGQIPASRYLKIRVSMIGPIGSPARFALCVSDVTREAEARIEERREKALLRSQAQLRQVISEEAGQKLAESRELLESALSFARVGAWELDFSTGVISCTDQCKLNMGIRREDPLTEQSLFNEIMHPDDRERVRAELADAIGHRRTYEAEYRIVYPAGRWVLAGGSTRYDGQGRPVRMLGFSLDITARKMGELEHQRLAGVEREAREESERSSIAKDHFLAAVTHELRSPIGVILNWAEMLQRFSTRLDAVTVGGTIQRSARQLSMMVDDLLDTGAIVSGKLSINPVEFSLDALVGDIADGLRFDAQRKGLQLEVTAREPVRVRADEARIRQIVWNLAGNAIKFCESGGITMTLTRQAGWAVLQVSDTGCGISANAMEKIFDRFEQVNAGHAGRVGGLGLGLWLAKTLTERHGGDIAVRSDGAGQGATFTVRLPALET